MTTCIIRQFVIKQLRIIAWYTRAHCIQLRRCRPSDPISVCLWAEGVEEWGRGGQVDQVTDVEREGGWAERLREAEECGPYLMLISQ